MHKTFFPLKLVYFWTKSRKIYMGVFSTHFVPLISILAPKIMEEWNNKLFASYWGSSLVQFPKFNNFLDFYAKIFLILYSWSWNSLTGNAIVRRPPSGYLEVFFEGEGEFRTISFPETPCGALRIVTGVSGEFLPGQHCWAHNPHALIRESTYQMFILNFAPSGLKFISQPLRLKVISVLLVLFLV